MSTDGSTGTQLKRIVQSKNYKILYEKYPELAEAIRKEEVVASRAVVGILSALSKQELETIHKAAAAYKGTSKISCIKEKAIDQTSNLFIQDKNKSSSRRIFPLMPIKRIPSYDPDAEISSLSLTIPSWIASIDRKCSNTVMEETSAQARDNLIKALTELSVVSDEIVKKIKSEV